MVWTALDFETTGTVKGWPNEPWQLGLVKIEDGVILPETRWETLLHVGDGHFLHGRWGVMPNFGTNLPPRLVWPYCGRK